MQRMHEDKIGRKMEEYMGERGPDVRPKRTVQTPMMDDDLKREIDRIINQQVDE